MKIILKSMQKKDSGIPKEKLQIFEDIIKKYEARGTPSLGPECEIEFGMAMEELLTQEQRFRLFEQNGGCKGTANDKERIAFALEHSNKTLAKRIAIFNNTFGRNAVFNDDNTITITFACTHGYYKQAREKKNFTPPPTIKSYFERCAGGRLYEYQKALGVKLKIKSVDISSLKKNITNPVAFTFEVM
ncbi:MAG: hypothetical protein LBU83_13610 [Bacteroidales bacterium]|jgi:hypothetical protein|nr:hypothetical protein [Bacteroidales bacterium]